MPLFDMSDNKGHSPLPPLLTSRPAVAIPYLILIILATIVGFCGNVLILGAFIVSKRVRIVGNEYALNLALADLTVTIFADPFLILGVTAGEAWFADRPALCEFVALICLMSCVCAFLTLTAVTINRYIYVCHGNLHETLFSRFSIVVTCVLCWVLAASLELVNFDFIGWGDRKFDRKHSSCMWDRTKNLSYTLFLLIGLIGLPVMVMVIAYVLIFLKVKQVKHRVADSREATGDQSNDPRPSIPRGQVHQLPGRKWLEVVKSTRTFFLILVAFIITWGPYAIVNAVDVDDVIPLEVHLYVSAFAHMHAAANCVIYGATSPHFRSAYKRVLCMKSAAKGTGSGRFSLSPTVFATQGSVPMETCARVTEQQKQEFENEPQKASPEKFKIARTRQNRYSLS